MTRALVLQHIACEPPGAFEDVLAGRGAAITRIELDEGDTLPDFGRFDVVVAMGGPMSVNDEDAWPWLAEEKRRIGAAVRAGTPFWGACLGAQLLAAGLGARVYAGPRAEVGVLPVTLTAEASSDPVFGGLEQAALPALQWHGDTFDLPAGAVLLASSAVYPHQAFRWGRRAYAVQFHLEVSTEMAKAWAAVPEYEAALEQVLGPGSFPALLDAFEARRPQMEAAARGLFGRWLDVALRT